MIYQTDSKNENIRKWGCLFVCLGLPAERISNRLVDDDILCSVYDDCVNSGYMKSNCYVLNYIGVMLCFADALDVKLDAQYLYKFKGGEKILNMSRDKWIDAPDFFITYFVIDKDKDGKINDENNGHFIETTGSGKIIFDPLGKSKAGQIGKMHSSRCFYVGGRE